MWYRRFRTLAVLASAGLLFQMFLPSVVAGELADKSDPPPLAPYPATWAFRIALAEPGESVVGLIYGTASVGGDGTGTYTGTIEETGATPSPISGTISMSVDPSGNTVVIDTTDPEFSVPMDNGIIDPDENFVIGCQSGYGEATVLFVMVRVGSGYSTSDLAGTWAIHTMGLNPDGTGSGCTNGDIILDALGHGTYDVNFEDTDGGSGSESGTVSLSVDGSGNVTAIDTTGGGSDILFDNGILSRDKNLIVFSARDESDDIEFGFLVRRGTDYQAGDVAGNWVCHAVSYPSDSTDTGTLAATLMADASGPAVVNGVELDQTGLNEMVSGLMALTVDSQGTVTLTDASEEPPEVVFDNGTLSSDKDFCVASYIDEDDVEFVVAVRDGKGFAQADLAGQWETNNLFAGSDAPWWGRGLVTIQADGSFSGTIAEYDGSSSPIAGDFYATADGFLTSPDLGSQLQAVMDMGKTVAIATKSGPDPGTAEADVAVKRAPSYSSLDLPGQWNMSLLATGPGAPWWGRGAMTVASGGSVSGTLNRYGGGSDSLSGTMSINMFSGIISWNGRFGDFRAVLDSGKTVMVWTDTWDENYAGAPADGTSEIAVLLKRAGSYSASDLAGLWQINSLLSGPQAPGWSRGYALVHDDGLFVGHLIDLDGSARWYAGLLSIDGSGIVTLSGNPTFSGAMDAGKTVIAATETLMDAYASSQLDLWVKVGDSKWFEMYPKNPEVSVGEYLNFTDTLGLGDYVLDNNDSGGTIAPDTGLYRAGSTGDVLDIVGSDIAQGHAVSIVRVISAPRDPGVPGPPTSMDVNGSGIGIDDVILMLRHVVALEFLDEMPQYAADFDCDGAVTISDVINALRVAVGLEPVP